MNYLDSFLREATKHKEFFEAMTIVKNNSSGGAWIIGGFVFRNIVSDLYGTPKPKVDLDFIIENPNKCYNLPSDWRVSLNRFGNPKFIGPSYDIDFVPLSNIYSIKNDCKEPSIDNFLDGTPLNIQSIVYDVNENEILGKKGIESIKNKLLIPNEDFNYLVHAAKQKEMSPREYIQKYANELGFDYKLK